MIKYILLPQLIFLLFKTWNLFVRNVLICTGQKSNLNWFKQRGASVLRVLGYFTGTRVLSRAVSETLLASGAIAPSLGDSPSPRYVPLSTSTVFFSIDTDYIYIDIDSVSIYSILYI